MSALRVSPDPRRSAVSNTGRTRKVARRLG
jgi:hypothetical protein